MYMFAVAASLAFGAGAGFAADERPFSDEPANALQAVFVEPDTETVLNAPETDPRTLRAFVVTTALAPSGDVAVGYRLGTGDKIRVTVYGEPDLSGEFQVDGLGFVRLPLVGQVGAGGRTLREFETVVAEKFSEGYLRSPRVSAEVVNYRPFFILGEVNKPGEYAYVNGMNVVTAVALAGGYTYRADESDVYIRRNGRAEEEYPADERTQVLPGDIVRVTERFF
jgi:polysaccharide export outer membrane protein